MNKPQTNTQVKTDEPESDDYKFRLNYLSPRYWPVWIWLGFLWSITRLPYPVICSLGKGIGNLFYKIGGSRRRYAQRNVELCFPELSLPQREKIVKDCFAGTGLAILESGLVWWTSHDKLQKMVRFEGFEKLEDARQKGQPLMLVGMHNTCMEIGYAYVSHRLPLNVLFRVNDNDAWEYIARLGRRRHNARLIPRKQVKELLHYMSEGEPGLILPDHDLGKKRSIFVPFFGIPTATVPSAGDFAEQTGAKVVFIQVYREWGKGYVIKVSDFIDDIPSDNPEIDTALISAKIEEAVRRFPDQYLWLHRRFKSRPDGEESLYKQ